MGRKEKLLERFLETPKDFRWDELTRLLKSLGFSEIKTGKTGGSRRKFSNSRGLVLTLHKPHPGKIVKAYILREIREKLIAEGILN